MKDYRPLKSELYKVAGYGFRFSFVCYRELHILFPETTSKYDKSLARCNIVFLSYHTINCGTIEVKQKDLTKGCKRTITSISQKDIDKYSEPNSHISSKKDLTLQILITMQ